MRAGRPRRALRALAIAALLLAAVGCGDDDGDDDTGALDANPGAETEADVETDVGGDTGVEGDTGTDPEEEQAEADAPPFDPESHSLDDLTEDQAAYALYVCRNAERWTQGSLPASDDLGIIGSVLNAGEGGPLLEPFGAELIEIADDPATGSDVFERIVAACAAYPQPD